MQTAGFGLRPLSAEPQIFSSPVLLFGTPNARVVPVEQTSNGVLPLNLTQQALPTASAILQISRIASLAGLSGTHASAPAASAPVQQITSTVQSLLIGKIYPAPVFSILA